jgi:hypothetical protein
MKSILQKLKNALLELEQEHGPITVCALFLREEPLQIWDIVISAPWLNAGKMESYQIIGSKIQETLSGSEIVQFSRVVILDESDPVTAFLQGSYPVSNDDIKELPGDPFSERFGFTIKRAYLLRCQKAKA